MPTRTIEVSDLVDAIERRIEELGISDSAAARRIGVSRQRLGFWRRGTQPDVTDVDLQRSLARFLGVSPLTVLELAGLDLSSEELGGYLSRHYGVAV